MTIKELWEEYLPSVQVDHQFHDDRSEDAGHTNRDRSHGGQTLITFYSCNILWVSMLILSV